MSIFAAAMATGVKRQSAFSWSLRRVNVVVLVFGTVGAISAADSSFASFSFTLYLLVGAERGETTKEALSVLMLRGLMEEDKTECEGLGRNQDLCIGEEV